jgi:hypothetical protein
MTTATTDVSEYDAIGAWRLDEGARARMDEDIAQELGVNPVYVIAAYHSLNMPNVNDAPRLEDYIAAVRAALIKAVKTRQARTARLDRACMAIRCLERKAKRARALARAQKRLDAAVAAAPRAYCPSAPGYCPLN